MSDGLGDAVAGLLGVALVVNVASKVVGKSKDTLNITKSKKSSGDNTW